MKTLSSACAKGRINTAGCRLAVFFLFCLCFFTACPLNASDSGTKIFPFIKEGNLCLFDSDSADFKTCSFGNSFTSSGVAPSKKSGWSLAWNKAKGQLYHVNGAGKLKSKTSVSGATAYVDKNYVLMQGSSFDENKGFSFTLYSIKYSFGGKKIALKQLWHGFIDCFVSDSFFTENGVCVAGGSRDNTKHNVFYITASGIHRCFTMAKNSDFLRLVSGGGNKLYAFLSQREKSKKEAVIYSFTLDGQPDQAVTINLAKDPALPPDFDCFFGYGFEMPVVPEVSGGPGVPEGSEGPVVPEALEGAGGLILPASINGIINFITYDCTGGKIARIIPEAVGCTAFLGSSDAGALYIARDPLIDASWYGIALFDGKECKKIKKIF